MWYVITYTVCVACKSYYRHYCGFSDFTANNRSKKQNKKKERDQRQKEGLQYISGQCPHIISAENWFNMIKLMLGNEIAPSTLSNLHHICRHCQSKSVSFTAQQITQSFKHLTLTGSDCQLRKFFSLSVYQCILYPVCLPFILFWAGQNNPCKALSVSYQDSQSKRWILGMPNRKCINIPEGTV